MNRGNNKKIFGAAIIIILLLMTSIVPLSATKDKTLKENGDGLPLRSFTHTVFGEEGTATWCGYCPTVMQILDNIYNSGEYDFYYVALVADKNTYALQRINELGITGYPTVVYDGGYRRLVGAAHSQQAHINAITACGNRAVADIDLSLEVDWLGNAQLGVNLDVTNNDATPYSGHVRVFVTEINSRWYNQHQGGVQYHYAMIGNYAINQVINVPAGTTLPYQNIWDGNLYGMEDIELTNIMVIAAVYRSGTNYVDETTAALVRDTFPPEWQNQGQNHSVIQRGEPILLYAQGQDNIGLSHALLATNETGIWQNITNGDYGSPMYLGDIANQWVWSNFSWQHSTIPQGRTIGWRIYYNDTSGNWNSTDIMSFYISKNPLLYDHTPTVTYTDAQFTFNASAFDDDGIAGVYVEYRYGTGPHVNSSMIPTGINGYYEKTITIPTNETNLQYIISAQDNTLLWSNTGEKTIPIIDTIAPEWQNLIQSTDAIPQGGSIILSAQGRDNIGVSIAWLATNETGVWLNFSGAEWWDDNWNYCKQIVIDHTKVGGMLTNFPVLIATTSSDFVAHAQPSGNDFVFVDATNTTVFNHEIEYYNSETGELVAWVQIPFLSSSEDTLLYLYYGNPECENQENVQGTWDDGFVAVYHMTGADYMDMYDSTHNNYDITSKGGTPEFNQPGMAGRSVRFKGSGDFLQTTLFRLPANTSYTASAWVYVDGGHNTRREVFSGIFPAFYVQIATNNRVLNLARTTSGPFSTYSDTIIDSANPEWHYVVSRVNTEDNTVALLINGVMEQNVPFTGELLSEDLGLNIGTRHNPTTAWMVGRIDEIRFSNVPRSDAWILTEYNNIVSPLTFATVGQEIIRGAGWGYGSPMELNSGSYEWVWSNFTWENPVIPSGTTIGWRIYYLDATNNVVCTDEMNFMITESSLLHVMGYCSYPDFSPANNIIVDIINLNTGKQWQAQTTNNHYSRYLIIEHDIHAGDILRIIARDGDGSVNVTDHLIDSEDISAGFIQVDLVLDIHYRDLKHFPFYYSQVDTGAMVMKQMLDFLRWNSTAHPEGPPSVYSEQELFDAYRDYHFPGLYYDDDSVIDEYQLALGLVNEIRHTFPVPPEYPFGGTGYYGYFFSAAARETALDALKWACTWIDYPVDFHNDIRYDPVPQPGHTNHVPVAVPTGGNYDNWMVIRGIHTSANAWPYGSEFDIYGFWINDPSPGGIGDNWYMTAQYFLDNYFDAMTMGLNQGQYVVVVDPPEVGLSIEEMEAAVARTNIGLAEQVSASPSELRLVRFASRARLPGAANPVIMDLASQALSGVYPGVVAVADGVEADGSGYKVSFNGGNFLVFLDSNLRFTKLWSA